MKAFYALVMGSSEKNTVRFAVGDPSGKRSRIWRVWVHGNEVYLKAPDRGKVSLHASGHAHEKWGTERYDEWRIPEAIRLVGRRGTLVPMFGVLIPRWGLGQKDPVPTRKANKVTWKPPPPKGRLWQFTILKSDNSARNDPLPEVLGHVTTRDGTSVFVTAHLEEEPEVTKFNYYEVFHLLVSADTGITSEQRQRASIVFQVQEEPGYAAYLEAVYQPDYEPESPPIGPL